MDFIYPKAYVPSIYTIDFQALYEQGYRTVLFDVDNTLVAFDVMVAPEALVAFFDGLRAMGFTAGLVSNNNAKRVAALNEKLGLAMMPKAMKPLTHKLKAILKTLGGKPTTSIFVGDQLFTDCWVGNAMGMYTILVEPIQKKEQLITRVKRGTEKVVLRGYKKKHPTKK